MTVELAHETSNWRSPATTPTPVGAFGTMSFAVAVAEESDFTVPPTISAETTTAYVSPLTN